MKNLDEMIDSKDKKSRKNFKRRREDFSRGLIKYTSRDYNSIIQEFWSIVPALTDLWRPEADADPGVVLAKFMASIGDMLGVNLDWLATEMYAPSVTQRKDAEKLFGLIGYTLGWYTAAATEVTFTNNSDRDIELDFGFNGSNWSTLNAYADITKQSRTITYNILPMTNTFGAEKTRSIRNILTTNLDIFTNTDKVLLKPKESCTRVAIEGELRSYSVSVAQIKQNKYHITLPSQHIDTTCVWIMAKSNPGDDAYLSTQWIQCESTAEFITPEPRFAVTYDNYSNAEITISNYLNQLENYENNWLCIYWIDCSGVIGCVGEDVLTNLLFAKDTPEGFIASDISISNLSNTVELPNTYTITGASPETAKEAYYNSRNQINTWDSLVTLPDYNRFLNREPGVDCGVVIDCQKALEINLAIYEDKKLTDNQKAKMYIRSDDFPAGNIHIDWKDVLGIDFDPEDPNKFVFSTNFKTYTAMNFAIHNDFKNTMYGDGRVSEVQVNNKIAFQQYKPPEFFIQNIIKDYLPLQAMSVEIKFGFARIFNFCIVGTIYTYHPVSESTGKSIVDQVREKLRLHFAPAARNFGDKPYLTEVVDVVENSHDIIKYFDAGSLDYDCISWINCDPEFFNYISFARYIDDNGSSNIRIAPSCLVD